MQIIKDCTLDCTRSNNFKTYIAKQNDTNSRFIRAILTDNGTQLSVEGESIVVIGVKRSDGEIKTFQGSVENGDVLLPIPNWALEKVGYIECDVAVLNSVTQEKLSTTRFSLIVEDNLADGDDIVQDENYDFLLQLITDVDTAVKSCNSAAEKANDIYNTVEEKLGSGELKGDKGDKGDDGAPGKVQDVLVNNTSVLDGSTANINVGITRNTLASISAFNLKLGWEVYTSLTEIYYSGVERVYCDPGCLVYSDTYPRFILVAGQFRYSRDGKIYRCGGWLDGEFFSYPTVNDMLTELAKKQDALTSTQISNMNAIPNKQDKLSDEQLTNIANVSNKQDKLSDEQIEKLNSDLATQTYVDTATAKKQDTLTATQLSNISAVPNKQDKLTTTQLSYISAVPNKQDKLTTEQLNNISAVTSKQDKLTDTQLANIEAVTSKQDKLTAGANIKIENNVISLDIETATASTTYGGES